MTRKEKIKRLEMLIQARYISHDDRPLISEFIELLKIFDESTDAIDLYTKLVQVEDPKDNGVWSSGNVVFLPFTSSHLTNGTTTTVINSSSDELSTIKLNANFTDK